MQNQIKQAREQASKMFIFVAGGIYLLNGLLATFGGGYCPLGLPSIFDPIYLAWLWSLPVLGFGALVAYKSPTSVFTRHLLTIIIGLLCTITPDVMPLGNYGPLRIEGHFIFFVAMVYLAMALDYKVLLSFTALVGLGHVLLGIYAPMCIYGVPQASITRALIHAGFVGLETLGLLWFINQRLAQLRERVVALQYHEQVDLFSTFITRLPVAVVMTDLNMKILAVSDEWRSSFHVGANGIIGKSYYDVVKVTDTWKANHQLTLKEGHSFIYRDDTISIDGKMEYVNRKLVPWFSGGKVSGLIAATQFVTSEITARSELARIHIQVDELEAAKTALLEILEERKATPKQQAESDAATLEVNSAKKSLQSSLDHRDDSAQQRVETAAKDAAIVADEAVAKEKLRDTTELANATSDSAAATIASAAATVASAAATTASEAATLASRAAKENLQKSLDRRNSEASNGEPDANAP